MFLSRRFILSQNRQQGQAGPGHRGYKRRNRRGSNYFFAEGFCVVQVIGFRVDTISQRDCQGGHHVSRRRARSHSTMGPEESVQVGLALGEVSLFVLQQHSFG